MDTNVLAYLFLPGERAAESRAVLSGDSAWEAPFLWRSEFRNTLAGLVRRGDLELPLARAYMDAAERHMAGHEHRVASSLVLELIAKSRCTAYDLEFAALALTLGVKLVTADRQLLAAFPDIAVPL